MAKDAELPRTAWRRSPAGLLCLLLAMALVGDTVREALAFERGLFDFTPDPRIGLPYLWAVVAALGITTLLALRPWHKPAMLAGAAALVVGYAALVATLHAGLQAVLMLTMLAIAAFHYQRLSDRMLAIAGVDLDATEMAHTDGRDPGAVMAGAISVAAMLLFLWWMTG